MAKQPRQQKVDVAALAAQVQVLRDQIEALQDYLGRLVQARDSVVRSIEGLKALKGAQESFIVHLDPNMNAAVAVNLADRDRVIVHMGLNVYAKMGFEDAIKILEERRGKLEKAIEETRKAIGGIASLHDQYQALLQRTLAEAEKRG
ncbi:MAG: prefoldin subunit alpha [Thermoprotei archaeon]|nr:prefoldin subunit alpha [Thermoprotei archaeon]